MRKLLFTLAFLAGALAFIPTVQAMPHLTTPTTFASTSVAPSSIETVQYYGRREWRRREWRRRQAWRRGYRRY
jgi:hypothetical protein